MIFNTLSVTVAQRTRELATLRTLGASRAPGARLGRARGARDRRAGVADRPGGGLGLAKALESMFASMGMQLPNAGTVFATRTVIVSLAAGIAVTLLASVVPALRATRVAPIAAVREGAILPPGRFARAQSLVADRRRRRGRWRARHRAVRGRARDGCAGCCCSRPARRSCSSPRVRLALARRAARAALGRPFERSPAPPACSRARTAAATRRAPPSPPAR